MFVPTRFYVNPVAALDNHFMPQQQQQQGSDTSASGTWREEHRDVVELLHRNKIRTVLLHMSERDDDVDGSKPDAIFPNNSFSLDENREDDDESIVLRCVYYPMSPGRKNEIPKALQTVISDHVSNRQSSGVVLWDERSHNSGALEGTGAINFTHLTLSELVMCRSLRASEETLHALISKGSFGKVHTPPTCYVVDTKDKNGSVVYHTNVVGWIGTDVEAWCVDCMVFSSKGENDRFMRRFTHVLNEHGIEDEVIMTPTASNGNRTLIP
eukprot:PhF_6_TR11593/c1_g1_i2/m.18767